MALESGKYTIVSKLDGAPIGRRNPETTGTEPKGIFKLPNNIRPEEVTTWVVEKLENGNYKFIANHSLAVGAIDGLLFAILFEYQLAGAAIEWTLKRDERDTEGNAYVVTVADQGDGWVAPSGDNEQIAVKPIVVGLTFPPTYLPNTLFVFKKIE
ncbi:hypothetical protein V8D89_004104 [Ganoderma adspersum]